MHRPIGHGELPLLEQALQRARDQPALGSGYPRCASLDSLRGELGIFGQSLENSFFVVEGGGGMKGCYGVLREGASPLGFLVGPFLLTHDYRRSALGALLRRIRQENAELRQLRTSVREENLELSAALASEEWFRGGLYLEMWANTEVPARTRPPVWSVGQDSHDLPDAASLLGEVHGWSLEPSVQLRRYLDLGFSLSVAGAGSTVDACLLARMETGLLRIEWICTRPGRRRGGLASGLMACALAEAAEMGAERAWLTVRQDNDPARGFFERMGFETVARSTVFAIDLRS